jgi:hypothetical protein
VLRFAVQGEDDIRRSALGTWLVSLHQEIKSPSSDLVRHQLFVKAMPDDADLFKILAAHRQDVRRVQAVVEAGVGELGRALSLEMS